MNKYLIQAGDNILIASDHAGFELKDIYIKELSAQGYKIIDIGPNSEDPVDYPDYANKLAGYISTGAGTAGVLICGTGIGISIAANRWTTVRAALVHSVETAASARKHNNANVMVVGARILTQEVALACLHSFLSTKFDGGRHIARVEKLCKPPTYQMNE